MQVEIKGKIVNFKRVTGTIYVGPCPFCDEDEHHLHFRAMRKSLKARCSSCRVMVLLTKTDFGLKEEK